MSGTERADLLQSMKRVATLLREADVRFALAGSAAAYARGGPAGEHDIDFVVHHEDVRKALMAAADAGLRTENPPEDWLVKVYDGGRLVDLIFQVHGRLVDDEMLARAEPITVCALQMPVLDAGDLVVSKLLSLGPHHCDFGPPLLMVRVLREQIDWHVVRAACADSPYATAFLQLVDALGISRRPPTEEAPVHEDREEEPWTDPKARATTSTWPSVSKKRSRRTSAPPNSASA